MSQHSGICASTPEEEGIQGTVSNEVDRSLLSVFEHVLQDPGDTASQLGVFLLSSQVEDDTQTDTGYIISVSRKNKYGDKLASHRIVDLI